MAKITEQTEAKGHKPKNFSHINGSCKMAKLTDGLTPKPCEACGTVSKMKICPFCRKTIRGRKL